MSSSTEYCASQWNFTSEDMAHYDMLTFTSWRVKHLFKGRILYSIQPGLLHFGQSSTRCEHGIKTLARISLHDVYQLFTHAPRDALQFWSGHNLHFEQTRRGKTCLKEKICVAVSYFFLTSSTVVAVALMTYKYNMLCQIYVVQENFKVVMEILILTFCIFCTIYFSA